MNIIKTATAVLVSAVISVAASANNHTWEADKINNEGALAMVTSERFSRTHLIVYVEKEKDCGLRLAIMTELGSSRDIDDYYTGEISARMRIDNNSIWTNDKASTYVGSSNDALFDSLSTLTGELLGQMLSGKSIIVQVGDEKTNKFSPYGLHKSSKQSCPNL